MTAREATVVGSLSEAPAIRPGPSAGSRARGRRTTPTIAGPAPAVVSFKRISSLGWSRPLCIGWIMSMQDACQHDQAGDGGGDTDASPPTVAQRGIAAAWCRPKVKMATPAVFIVGGGP